jgi:hypothetical protein
VAAGLLALALCIVLTLFLVRIGMKKTSKHGEVPPSKDGKVCRFLLC